jgi:hypothetical protein
MKSWPRGVHRFKALLVEPSALAYAERHDNLEGHLQKAGVSGATRRM